MVKPAELNTAAFNDKVWLTAKSRTSGRKTVHIASAILSTLFGITAAINLHAFALGTTSFNKTHLAAVVLSLYLLFEALRYLHRSDTFGLISPVLLALVAHFYLAYLVGITVAAFEPNMLERHATLLSDLDNELADTLFMATLAVFCMLRGYGLARPSARVVLRTIERMPQVKREFRADVRLLMGLQIVYLMLVAYAIEIGAYGLLSSEASRAQYVDVQQFLNAALAAGTLSYFLILLRFFELRTLRKVRTFYAALVWLMIAVHVFTGALTGFKSQIVFPLVIAGFAHFMMTRRVPIYFSVFTIVALVVAYTVIEPYRSYLGELRQPPASITEAVKTLGTSISMRDELAHVRDISQAEAISSRFDFSGMTALAIDYVDNGRLLPHEREEFQDSILLAPLLAYVPRALWQSKRSFSPGVWYNQNVRERWHDETTSVGMGPIGYLYMAGGTFAVIIGFTGFGALQALIFEGIGRGGAGGLIIYLSVAITLVGIPTSFGPSVTGILRMLPLAFVIQWLLLSRGTTSRMNIR